MSRVTADLRQIFPAGHLDSEVTVPQRLGDTRRWLCGVLPDTERCRGACRGRTQGLRANNEERLGIQVVIRSGLRSTGISNPLIKRHRVGCRSHGRKALMSLDLVSPFPAMAGRLF